MGRRGFLSLLSAVMQGAVAAAAVVPGISFLVSAARTRRRRDGFIPAITVGALKPDVPTRAMIRMDKWDAYLHYPPGAVGAVWLVPETSSAATGTAQSGAPEIRCLQTICPHLGCAINFAPDRNVFVCPCHASEFTRSGEPISGPTPRPMDRLPCRVSAPDANGDCWVEIEYHEFKTGTPRREPIA
jgi:quinol---cytochrome c reductase iron-sulfur subunit, bacillus type